MHILVKEAMADAGRCRLIAPEIRTEAEPPIC
jgi:hypothetical protein